MIFFGLATLMLQRSVAAMPADRLWQYAPPAIGCAAVDFMGTNGYVKTAIGLLFAITFYIVYVLRPVKI